MSVKCPISVKVSTFGHFVGFCVLFFYFMWFFHGFYMATYGYKTLYMAIKTEQLFYYTASVTRSYSCELTFRTKYPDETILLYPAVLHIAAVSTKLIFNISIFPT